ncbi:DUF4382 domain-containing protein [Geothrix oryzisoli]|uniref:DUF4382 domain-containing protein n=1 Tax=Geothrix oryzisoli TaxID=2922721 RepID=UPI001FAC4D3C|nr:DUF4382 domain-containing protein [Geothrix oryzisoli]
MQRWRTPFLWLAGLGLALMTACSGSSSGGGSGTMNVHLVDGPIAGYQEINVNIQTVEIASDGGWITLGTPNKTINLLSLVGGVDETLVAGATLPAGHYGQMRLVLGSGNTVKLSDGTVEPLKVPSGMQSGIKLIVNFDVAAGTTKDVWIDFDAAHSIQVVQAGASGQYLLRPTIWAFDKLVTGSIHGVLTDAATSTGLPGATVYAEVLDGSGNARISRSTVTDATGAYTLDLLPVGATYYVVSQPLTGTTPKAYDAKASEAFALTATTPVFTYSAAFTANASTGGVSGGLTPLATSSQSDQVNLLQSLVTSSGTFSFIVRTTMAVVGTTETYGFTTVPVGTYGVQAVRSTLNLDGTTTTTTSTVQPATVTASTTATVNLGL